MLFRLSLRKPDVVLGGQRPYMRRWYIIRRTATIGNVYLHHILRSDDDRALHDHPWWNISIVVRGGYWEWKPAGPNGTPFLEDGSCRRWRGVGSIVFRRATSAHRLELPEGRTAWSIFITGKKTREWGFHCPRGWKHWREFIACPTGEPTGSEVGPGCGD